MNKRINTHSKGFTLVELLLATGIIAVVLVGLIQVFIRCTLISELTRTKTAALSEAFGKMEEIRNYSFDSIYADYNDTTFTLSQLDVNGKQGNGFIYITEIDAGKLLEVEIVITWWDKGGRSIYDRIVGEDTNKNGVLDLGAPSEDVDGNGKMSSTVTLISRIADRV